MPNLERQRGNERDLGPYLGVLAFHVVRAYAITHVAKPNENRWGGPFRTSIKTGRKIRTIEIANFSQVGVEALDEAKDLRFSELRIQERFTPQSLATRGLVDVELPPFVGYDPDGDSEDLLRFKGAEE